MEGLTGWPSKSVLKDWLGRTRGLITKKGILRNFKGFAKDPLFYLGFAAVTLFGFITILTPTTVSSPILADEPQASNGTFVAPISRIRESSNLSIVQNNTLAAVSPPILVTPQVLGMLAGGADYEIAQHEVSEYIVEQGDTLKSIANKFNISEDTIRWANNITGSTVRPGQRLAILPVTGTLHLVRQSDTLSEIAAWYKADIEEIRQFNGVDPSGQIFAGDFLVIPNGIQPARLPSGRLTPIAGSYFICPVGSSCRITQGLHWYNAIDFSNGQCGESVYAAAGGVVQRRGYSAIGGNFITILHPNGVATYYGHFSSMVVSPGERVLQGQIIGYTGRTGVATGCHVHWEVRGAKNPFIK